MNRQQIGIYPTDSVEYRHIEKIADALTEMGVSVDVDAAVRHLRGGFVSGAPSWKQTRFGHHLRVHAS